MKRIIALASVALLLSSCGGNSDDNKPSHNINVTGSWAGSLQTTAGGGLGATEATFTQSASGTGFKGTLSTPVYGGSYPVVGDVAQGTLATDLSASGVNKDLAISCKGTFTSTSYKGNCSIANSTTPFVLALTKK